MNTPNMLSIVCAMIFTVVSLCPAVAMADDDIRTDDFNIETAEDVPTAVENILSIKKW